MGSTYLLAPEFTPRATRIRHTCKMVQVSTLRSIYPKQIKTADWSCISFVLQVLGSQVAHVLVSNSNHPLHREHGLEGPPTGALHHPSLPLTTAHPRH